MFIPIAFQSCKSSTIDEVNEDINNSEEEISLDIFPETVDVDSVERTDFVLTLESDFDLENNAIYSATMPFAWNEIKSIINAPLEKFTNSELEILNQTESYVDVLNSEEYDVNAEVSEKEIRTRAFFRISLPFKDPFTKSDYGMSFNETQVESFGCIGYHRYCRINYYNNENDFSISLDPKDKAHEIILIMNSEMTTSLNTFEEIFDYYVDNKVGGIGFEDDDRVDIPIVEFNLEKNFQRIIGTSFISTDTMYNVTEFYQSNAFLLNEKGAEVESEAIIEIEEVVEELGEKPKPKAMIFNRPFFIFLKRRKADYPYFGVYIANDELLKKVDD